MKVKYVGPQPVFGHYHPDGKKYVSFPNEEPVEVDGAFAGVLLSRSDFKAVEPGTEAPGKPGPGIVSPVPGGPAAVSFEGATVAPEKPKK
jgi:hypothetical protein